MTSKYTEDGKIIEYVRSYSEQSGLYDEYYCMCVECNEESEYDSETSTYKCSCGWESADVHDNPGMFIEFRNGDNK